MTESLTQARRRLLAAGIDFQSDGGTGFDIYRDRQRIGRVYSEAALIAWREEAGGSTTPVLSAELQDCARRYVAAQRRSGDALLEACSALYDARQLAQHGEWGRFLEATRMSESAAKRLLDIHQEAARDPQFADAVRTNWIGATVAGEIAQSALPAESRAALLGAETPPTVAVVTQAKRAIKSSIMEDLKPNIPDVSPKPATCTRCGEPRSDRRSLTTYQAGLVPEYPDRVVVLCSHCVPELLAARRAPAPPIEPDNAPHLPPDFAQAQQRAEKIGLLLSMNGLGEFALRNERGSGVQNYDWPSMLTHLMYQERAAATLEREQMERQAVNDTLTKMRSAMQTAQTPASDAPAEPLPPIAQNALVRLSSDLGAASNYTSARTVLTEIVQLIGLDAPAKRPRAPRSSDVSAVLAYQRELEAYAAVLEDAMGIVNR